MESRRLLHTAETSIPSIPYPVVNALLFQGFWLAAVLGAASGRPWLGPALLPGVAAAHLAARPGWRELLPAAAALVIGYGADSALVLLGLLHFPEQTGPGGPSPLWMVALWGNLGIALRASLGWLRPRPRLAGALGAVGGPVAYFGGASLDAVRLGDPTWLSLAAVGAVYLVATPVLCLLAERGPSRT
ncbi:MAG: DUF2878 domain-containing protein [Candidatus Palauibacterales bacterium]|nr:DUF2878 domain-containing protein [Candidatus Palauibacterales bacterium]